MQAIKIAPWRESAAWRRASRPRRARRQAHRELRVRVRYDASESRQPNLYGYVLGDPVNGFDPYGLYDLFPVGDVLGDGQEAQGTIFEATMDFVDNYLDLREANTIGADAYFHCIANCEATSRGGYGEATADVIGFCREVSDYTQASGGEIDVEAAGQSLADLLANEVGQEAARQGLVCRLACDPFRPGALSPAY